MSEKDLSYDNFVSQSANLHSEDNIDTGEKWNNYLAMKEDFSEIDCKYNVGRANTIFKEKRKKKVNKSAEYERLLKRGKELLEKGALSDYFLKEAAAFKAKKIQYLSLKAESGNLIWFDSNTKGSTSYGRRMKQKIYVRAKEFQEINPEVVFMTWTCDIKEYDGNRLRAWEHWIDKMYNKLHTMQKKLGCLYVGVLEATKKQFPHIHILLFFPRGKFHGYEKMPRNVDIKYGKIFRALREFRPARIWNVKIPENDKVAGYLTKYVTKSSTSMLKKMAKNKGNLSSEDVKAISSWLIPSIVGRRQYFKSKCKGAIMEGRLVAFGEKWDKDFALDQYSKLVFTKMSDTQFAQICAEHKLCENALQCLEAEAKHSARATRRYLIYLCTNLSCHKLKDVRKVSSERFFKLREEYLREHNGEEPDYAKLIWENTEKSTCPGCFQTDMRDLMLGNLNNRLNIKYLRVKDKEKGITCEDDIEVVRYITEEDYKNDAKFLAKFGRIRATWQMCSSTGQINYYNFAYFNSKRQRAFAYYKVRHEMKHRSVPQVKDWSFEEKGDFYAAMGWDYLDIHIDMKKEGLLDLGFGELDDEVVEGKPLSLWEKRCRTMGYRGLWAIPRAQTGIV